MRHSAWLLGAALLLTACGTPGEFRRISFSDDLTSADVAHYRAQAEKGSGDTTQLEDYSVGLPWWPWIWRVREGDAARDEGGEFQYHFEDDWGLVLWVVGTNATANYDGDGRNLSWRKGQTLLLGSISNSSGEAVVDGERRPTSAFQLLWGLFGTERTTRGRTWRLLWIPIVGD